MGDPECVAGLPIDLLEIVKQFSGKSSYVAGESALRTSDTRLNCCQQGNSLIQNSGSIGSRLRRNGAGRVPDLQINFIDPPRALTRPHSPANTSD